MAAQTTWRPANLEERIERVEALDQIRQLASRYALAVDTRNLDDLAALFVEDVRVGRDEYGREAIKKWYGRSLERFGTSIHFVGNQVIDFVSAEEATGVVTCHDELEMNGEWHLGKIQYWDNYVRRDGTWYFKRRRLQRWYLADALTRPSHGGGVNVDPAALKVGQLPDIWPSWNEFWNARGTSPR
ncbi:SnoaL-like domain-containing protein [Novosphingobium sp. CF614]|uniref:nuclear transport factor 2 family protein n=1 Tax=Novosphingobium sp. CF614 TaxID=1884364 RepID=UPI0008F01952|nr:nuclear transport factor 2 family protein [Novosphingobium sp. CF614]SFF96610.1 SnoaL-like domain-containing protein [Novosphingobium sp. CF614]